MTLRQLITTLEEFGSKFDTYTVVFVTPTTQYEVITEYNMHAYDIDTVQAREESQEIYLLEEDA